MTLDSRHQAAEADAKKRREKTTAETKARVDALRSKKSQQAQKSQHVQEDSTMATTTELEQQLAAARAANESLARQLAEAKAERRTEPAAPHKSTGAEAHLERKLGLTSGEIEAGQQIAAVHADGTVTLADGRRVRLSK